MVTFGKKQAKQIVCHSIQLSKRFRVCSMYSSATALTKKILDRLFSLPFWMQSIFLGVALILCVYFPLLTGKSLLYGDNYSLMVPGKLFTAYWLKQGILPFWNPTIFAGIPWIGDINQSILYPTTLFFVILPPAIALNATILIHVISTFVGMSVLARRLRIAKWASFLAAVLWTFNPQITGSINNISTLQSLSWMPWVVFFGLGVASKTNIKSGRGMILFCFAVLAQFLGGYPQHVIYSIATAVIFSLYVFFEEHKTVHNIWQKGIDWLRQWILAAVLVVPLTAVAWLPFLEVLQQSTRVIQTTSQAAAGSLHVSELLKSIHPHLFEHPAAGMKWGPLWNRQPNLMLFISWFGTLMLVLAALQKRIKKSQLLFLATIFISLVIAMGDSLPTFTLIQKIPIINASRGMSTILMIPALILPILVAVCIDSITIGKHVFRFLLGTSAAISAGTSFGLIVVWTQFTAVWQFADELLNSKLSQSAFHTISRDFVISEVVLLTLLVTSLSLFFSLLFWRQKRLGLLLLIITIEMAYSTQALLFSAPAGVYKLQTEKFAEISQDIDLSQHRILTRNYNTPYTDFGTYWDAMAVRAPFSDSYIDAVELRELNHLQRMRDALTPNWNMVAGVPSINGFTTLLPLNMHQDFSVDTNPNTSTNYFVENNIVVSRAADDASINSLPYIQLDNDSLKKWSVKYYLVDTWFPDFGETFPEKIVAKQRDLTLYEIPNTLPRFRTKNGAPVTITNYSENPNKISFTITLPDDSGLLIADRYDTNWHVKIDDKKAVVENYEGMQFLPLTEYETRSYSISLEYFPTYFYLGLVSTCLVTLLMAVYLVRKPATKIIGQNLQTHRE